MKKVIIAILCVFFAAPGCALKKELVIPRAKLQESVAKKFPYAKDMGIARLTVETPEVYFKGQAIGLKALYACHVLSADVKGTIDVSGRIIYRPETGAFYVRDLVVSDFTVDKGNIVENVKLQNIMDKMVGTYLDGFPLYQLNPNDYKENLARSMVRDIVIRDDDLVILLGK